MRAQADRHSSFSWGRLVFLAHADVRSAPGRSSGDDVDAAAGSMRRLPDTYAKAVRIVARGVRT